MKPPPPELVSDGEESVDGDDGPGGSDCIPLGRAAEVEATLEEELVEDVEDTLID